MSIIILADSKRLGNMTHARCTNGRILFREGHLPLGYRTPRPVRDAICRAPKGGRMMYAGTIYRWSLN